MVLYKFLAPERVDVLQNGMIRFTQPAALNDPFECRPRNHTAEMLYEAVESQETQCLETYVQEVQDTLTLMERRSVGMICLAADATNIAMWAHYGANHGGFVIGFDSTHPFFEKRGDGTGLWKVRYSEGRPLRPLGPTVEHLKRQPGLHSVGHLDLSFPSPPTFNPDTYQDDYRFIKSTCWEYEKEWRLLRTLEGPDRTILQEKRLPIHLFKFPPTSVKSVIIGCRALRTIYGPIRDILDSDPGYADVAIYIAEAHSDRFELDTRPFRPIKDCRPDELDTLPLAEQVDFMLAKGILVSLDEVSEQKVNPHRLSNIRVPGRIWVFGVGLTLRSRQNQSAFAQYAGKRGVHPGSLRSFGCPDEFGFVDGLTALASQRCWDRAVTMASSSEVSQLRGFRQIPALRGASVGTVGGELRALATDKSAQAQLREVSGFCHTDVSVRRNEALLRGANVRPPLE